MRLMSILFFVFQISLLGQDTIDPSPQCGWDSLKLKIRYPDLALRVGYRTALIASIDVNSKGNIEQVNISPFTTTNKYN